MKALRNLIDFGRYPLILPIIGALLLTVSVVIMGLGVILVQIWQLVGKGEFSQKAAKQLTINVIETIDLFLVGAISYITAVGIYKLFISQKEEQLLKRIKIETLDDLEHKIIGVVIAALAVAFLGFAAEATEAQSILQSGVGIAVVIGALCLFVRFTGGGESDRNTP